MSQCFTLKNPPTDADQGAVVDALDMDGYTPWHFATANYDKDAVVCLLKNGAHPLRRTKDGLTPLQIAQRSQHGTGLIGIAAEVDDPEKSATIDVLRTALHLTPLPP